MPRQVQVLIGPFKDYEEGNTNQAISLVSTGRADEFKIDFTVNKNINGTPNQTTLTLTNLSPETRQKLQTSQIAVEVYAGYVGEELKRVSKGGVLSAVSKRNGADIETTINVMDGYGATLRSFYNKSFAGKVAIKEVVTELAKNLQGVSLGEINVTGVLADKGRVISGSIAEQLSVLADNFDFSWSIQDGVFQALDDNKGSTNKYILSSDTSLLSITPLLNGPMQQQVGVEVSAVLDPRIKPGDIISIDSSISPSLNNDYKVTECQLSGSTHSDNWKIQIKSMKEL